MIADVCLQSLIDDKELETIQSTAERVNELVEAGNYTHAERTWEQLLYLVDTYSNGIDVYNFLVLHKQDLPINKRTLLENGEYM